MHRLFSVWNTIGISHVFCIIEEESTQDNSYTGNVFMENSHNEPKYIEVRGACVHNLKT